MWKRADLDGLRSSVVTASYSFLLPCFDGIESMWTAFKAAISGAVDQHEPTKFTSTRRTHPWVNTSLTGKPRDLAINGAGTGSSDYKLNCRDLHGRPIGTTWRMSSVLTSRKTRIGFGQVWCLIVSIPDLCHLSYFL